MQRDRLRIDLTGNVGIGTATPAGKLHLYQTNAANEFTFDTNLASGNAYALNPFIYGISNGGFSIRDVTNSTDGIVIQNATGNVGVGATTPTAKLQINGNVRQVTVGRIDNELTDSSGGTDAKWWAWSLDGAMGPNTFGLHTRTDAGVFGQVALQFTRSGSTIATTISPNGNVGIGTTNPTQKLSVNGTIRAKEIIVDTGWADYVFDDSYRLAPLAEVEQQIKQDKHLPGIPSAQEIAEHGVSMGEMRSKLLSKIEEITLHQIAQEKDIAELKGENAALRLQIAELKSASAKL